MPCSFPDWKGSILGTQIMESLRKYGSRPFTVAVIHGGPGAPGEMAPVAREISSLAGVLEPLQTAATLQGQVRELKVILEKDATLPVTLVGFSWGAMLSFIFAARYPAFAGKLVLIGSGPCEERYAEGIMDTRLGRLGGGEREEALALMAALDNPAIGDKDTSLARLGELISRADSCNPLPHDSEILETRYDIYRRVWEQAVELRRSGKLLELGKKVRCPVVAIHGDHDPHPYAGVEAPLSRVLKDFRFILLERCGHRPWIEREAKDRFYSILRNEIR